MERKESSSYMAAFIERIWRRIESDAMSRRRRLFAFYDVVGHVTAFEEAQGTMKKFGIEARNVSERTWQAICYN